MKTQINLKLLAIVIFLINTTFTFSQKIEVDETFYYKGVVNGVTFKIHLPNTPDGNKRFYFSKKHYNKNGKSEGGYVDIRYSSIINRHKRRVRVFKKSRITLIYPKMVVSLRESPSGGGYYARDMRTIATLTVYRNPNDFDEDGIPNSRDNCKNIYNPNQSDIDKDGIGDSCDSQDNRDSDGDGLQNYIDRCPYNFGPRSNKGCPVPQGKSDLYFYAFHCTASSDCRDCPSQISRLGSKRHKLSQYSPIFLNYAVRNEGKGKSKKVNLKAYVNYNGRKIELKEISRNLNRVPELTQYNVHFGSATITWNNFRKEVFKDFPDGYYNLMIEIPPTSNESNSSNNTLVLPIYLRKKGFSSSRMPIELSINSFNGSLIKQKVIKNEEEEKEMIESLPNGLYIINKNNKRTKLYKQN